MNILPQWYNEIIMRILTNYLKTTILLAGLTALFITLGYYFLGEDSMFAVILFSLIFNFVAYFFSDKIALAASGARELKTDELPWLHKEVEKLSKKMEIPVPRLYVSETSQANAFATGRNPKNGVVCVTAGLVNTLDRNQVIAVVAHELAHIKNRDILIGTIAAVVAGAISSLTRIMYWGGGSRRRDDNGNGLLVLLGLILAPIAAMLLQFAVSRSREYSADETAALYTGRPEDLASALVAIEGSVKIQPMDLNPAFASLYIQNSINARGVMELFSTHPLTEKRVERLMELNKLNK